MTGRQGDERTRQDALQDPATLQETTTLRHSQLVPKQPTSSVRTWLLLSTPERSQAIELTRGCAVIVGRSWPSCRLDDPTLSRRHARLEHTERGILLEDLGSRNGTWVNGTRVSQAWIAPSDRIRIGAVDLAVVHKTPAAAGPTPVVARNARTREAHALARRVASVDVPVLVLGETGVGKEIVARMVHSEGCRREGPLKALNCGAVPRELIESVLFGHERGAFTGAHRTEPGAFEQAHRGTLFLDEIGELSPAAQAALLRVVETKRVARVGGSKEIEIDTRLVAATHRDLHAMVQEGRFRADLLHRLDVVQIELPPLRERLDEIEPLVAALLPPLAARWQSPARALSQEAMLRLKAYSWPGNVRQLSNVLERCLLSCSGSVIEVHHLPEHVRDEGGGRVPQLAPTAPPAAVGASADGCDAGNGEGALRERLRAHERRLIEDALASCGGSRARAAEVLHIPLRTLQYKIRQHQL